MPSSESRSSGPRVLRAKNGEGSSLVVVDASFVLKLILPEEYSEQVRQVWEWWVRKEIEVSAPYLLTYEVVSVLRHKVFRGELSLDEGEAALLAVQAQGILLLHTKGLEQASWKLAKEFNRPTAYDTSYLALAQLLDSEFWTADERLKNALQGRLPCLRWVGELLFPGSCNGKECGEKGN